MNSLGLLAVAFLVTGAIILWFCDVHAHIEIDINNAHISDNTEDDASNEGDILDNIATNKKKVRRKKLINTAIISAAIVDILVGIIILIVEYNVFI